MHDPAMEKNLSIGIMKALHQIKDPEDKKRRLHMLRRLQKYKRRHRARMITTLNPIPANPNPEGLQYHLTPDDLIIMENKKRAEERQESGWWGGMGNN